MPRPASLADRPASGARLSYLRALALVFTIFNTLRTLAYLPNIAAIIASGNSDQHSLLTWLTLAGANATMALWIFEHNDHRADRVVLVNVMNTLMCALTSAVILAHR